MQEIGVPGGLAELLLGAAGGLWLFAAIAYGVKLARRPGVLADEFRVLPSRGGVAALSVGGMATAAALVPYAPGLAGGLLVASLLAHAGLGAVLAVQLRGMPAAARRVNPTLHLSYTAFVVGGLAASGLGWHALAGVLFWTMLPVAGVIWAVSLWQVLREVPPAPLRPLLAIHLAPASLLSSMAALTGHGGLAVGFAVLGGVILLGLVLSGRWLTVAGFSPMWGAFTFPLAAYAGALFGVGWLWPGMVVLIAALGVVPVVAWNVLRLWPGGKLAARTNAAEACLGRDVSGEMRLT